MAGELASISDPKEWMELTFCTSYKHPVVMLLGFGFSVGVEG